MIHDAIMDVAATWTVTVSYLWIWLCVFADCSANAAISKLCITLLQTIETAFVYGHMTCTVQYGAATQHVAACARMHMHAPIGLKILRVHWEPQ